MLARPAILVLPLLVGATLLSACGPTTPTPAATSEAPSPTPTPTPTAEALDPDIVLVVRATATADNGSILDLEEAVYRSTAWDDADHRDRPDLMSTVCEGSLEDSVYEENLWSFAQADIAATHREGTPEWPSTDAEFDHWIRIQPGSAYLSIAASGGTTPDPSVDMATPHCKTDQWLTGDAGATLVVGFQGDTDAVGAAGGFTRWANHSWGFSTKVVETQTAADTGVTISDCEIVVTDLGTELGAPADWPTQTNDGDCYVHPSTTEDEDS